MSGNQTGTIFKLISFGESHGAAIGGIVEGCPSGFSLDLNLIREQMQRRRPGQSVVTTEREEEDEVEFLSGLFNSVTTGTPIGFLIRNMDQRPEDYKELSTVYRPSHADFVYEKKYGLRDSRGGGRSSARETASRVVAGAIADQFIAFSGVSIVAWVSSVGGIKTGISGDNLTRTIVDQNIVRCPDAHRAQEMIKYIELLKEEGDSTGGTISCIIKNVPVGLGEPVFDKLHADLGKAMLSINAVHGFEFGSGFAGTEMKGSQHNDEFQKNDEGKISTKSNFSGGIQGGISNGMDIYFKVAFKPVSTIRKEQQTINANGDSVSLSASGRHDPCVVPRAVPIVEAMAALVIADHLLRMRTTKLKAE